MNGSHFLSIQSKVFVEPVKDKDVSLINYNSWVNVDVEFVAGYPKFMRIYCNQHIQRKYTNEQKSKAKMAAEVKIITFLV